MNTQPRSEPDPPIHRRLYLKVVENRGGYQPFLLAEGRCGLRLDLLPLRETPPMATYREAEELAIVVAWHFLDSFKNGDGEPIISALD